jgi:outer membrane protease
MLTSDADAFLTITNVNITFNNNAGLCSNMTQEQLYKASVASGLKNMAWAEFSGLTIGCSNTNYFDHISESRAGLSGDWRVWTNSSRNRRSS